jgi:hypothetical protein
MKSKYSQKVEFVQFHEICLPFSTLVATTECHVHRSHCYRTALPKDAMSDTSLITNPAELMQETTKWSML